MEQMDKFREQQVWQRVHPPEKSSQRQNLRALALAAGENEAAYRRLAGVLPGALREQAQGLLRQSRMEIATLSGLHRLSTGAALGFKPQPLPDGVPRELVQSSFYRSCRALTEYTARSAEPEFGPVFREMADAAQKRCAQLAQLMGQLT